MATGNESPEKMGIYQLPSHIHGTDNKSSKNRSRSNNNNNNNTRDVPATSIIIGNDVNTVDVSSLECSLYFDEENGTSTAVAAGNNRSAGNGKKIFRETNNNNNNNNMNRNVDKVQGVKYQNNITITTTTSPGKQSASSPLPNVKPTAIPATRRETRYRSSNNSISSSSHDEDPDHHHHPSNNSDTFFFSSLSRFITRQPQANKVVFFTSVFLVLCSLGLAAVGLGLSLQQSGFGGEGGDGGVDVDGGGGGGTSEPQYASLLNNDVPHVSTVDARDVKALLNSTAAELTTWPTFTPTSAPFDINEASIETTTAATESTETSSAATTTEEPARTQAPLASSTIVPDVATNIPADTTSTSSSSSSTEAPKTAEPFPTIPVDTSTVISGGSSTEATEAPTTEAPLPTTNVPDIATNIPVDTTSSASINSTTTETPETTTVTASTKPVLATDSVTITEAPGTSSSPVIIVDPASTTSSTAAQAITTEAAGTSSDPAIIVDSASGPTIAVDASTTTSSAAAQASTTGATETNVTSSDPTIPLDTTTSSIAAEATSAAATETNSTKEASNTTTTSTTTAKVPTPAPTTKSPTVSPTPIPVLSCPNIFDDFTVIDSKAVLYYSLVPSSFPGANNGLLCTRLEYDGIGWVALAISTNGQMIGSEAIIGLPDEGSVLKYDLNGKSDNLVAPMEDEKQTLRNTLIGQENGRTVMEFTKLLVEDGEIPILENGLNYFLHAKGMDNSLGYHISRWSFELNFKGGNIPSLEQASMSFPTHTPTVWMPTDWPTLYPTSSNFPSVPETKLDNSTEPGFDTLVVNPLADTFVEFGTDKIMGDKGRLKVDGKPERITLLRFDVSSLAGMGANVTKAALRLFAETSSPFGGVVEMFPGNSCSDWEEDTVNWGNSPPCVFGNNTKLLGTFGEVTMNKWNEAELKLDFKNLPPIMTLRISSNLANGVTFLSMDHPNGTMPELRFNYYGEVNSTVATPVVPDTEHPTYFPTLMPTTWMPTAPLAENMVIAATQDAMIRDGFYSDRLFGLDSYMSLQKAANEDNVRKIVLEFDLSNAIPSVVYAFTLKLYVTYVGSDESRTVTVYRAKNDFNWSEKSVTWDKFGSPAMEELTSREVLSDDVESGIAFSLGEFEPVNSKLILFLEITSSGEGYPSKIDFLSRNHGWNPPLLVATP